jgi:hypothetical protein
LLAGSKAVEVKSIMSFCTLRGQDPALGNIILLLGTAPAAPVFTMIMGAFYQRLETAQLRYGVVRGLTLVALGYILNVVRFSLPILIAGEVEPVYDGPRSAISLFFAVDILQMAGVSLIMMGFIKRYLPWKLVCLSLMTAIAIVSPMVWGTMSGFGAFSILWGAGEHVFFPSFSMDHLSSDWYDLCPLPRRAR